MSEARPWRRRLFIGIGAVVLLLVIAVVAVPVLVPAEKWKSLAFEQLESRTGLVGTAEDASVRLLPLGLRLEELRIDDPEGVTGLEEFAFSLESVMVRASLWSILRGSPEVAEVRLVRPVAELRLPPPSAAADADEGVGGAAGGPAANAAPPEVAAVLGLFSIEDGRIVVHDGTGTQVEVTGLQNTASLRTEAGRARGQLAGRIERTVVSGDSLPSPLEIPALSWDLDVDAGLDGATGRLTVNALDVAGARSEGEVDWETGGDGRPVLDVGLDVDVDFPTVWEELGRPQFEGQELPEPFTAEDFAIVGGSASLEVTFEGPVPDTEDLAVLLAPLRVGGTVEGLRARVLDRDDLFVVEGGVRVENAEVHLDDVNLTGALGTVGLRGGVGLALDEPFAGEAEADLDVGAVRALVVGWWPRLSSLAGEGASGPEQWPDLEGRAQLEADLLVPVDGSFDPLTSDPGAVMWKAMLPSLVVTLPTLAEPLRLQGARVQGDLQHAALSGGTVNGPGITDAGGQIQLSGWPERTIVRGRLVARRLDLDLLQAALVVEEETAWLRPELLEQTLGIGVARAEDAAELPPPPPAELDLDLQLDVAALQSSGYTVERLTGDARLEQQQLAVTGLEGQLGTGRLEGSARVDWTTDPPTWDSDAAARRVSASTLLEPFAGPLASALDAHLSGSIDLDGLLSAEPARILEALSGAVALESEGGVLAAESLLGPEVSRFLGAAAERWRRLDFSSLTANMSVRDGRVWFDRVFLSGDTEVGVGGSVGLDGRADYRLDVRLPQGVTPELGALRPVADLLRDDQGRITFAVNVTGPAAQPRVEIDLADLQDRARSGGEERLRDELEDRLGVGEGEKLEDAIGGRLQDLLGGGKTAAPAGSTAVDSTKVEEQKLEDTLKDAAGGLLDRLKRKKGGG